MKEAIDVIKEKLSELRERTQFDSIEEKSEHYGLINRYEMAIDRLNLCESYRITGGSIVNQLPDSGDIHQCFKVVHECESSDPCNWIEVEFENRKITLEGGDIVIRR
jgi:hypothetical protein